jgi:hypothetical protein
MKRWDGGQRLGCIGRTLRFEAGAFEEASYMLVALRRRTIGSDMINVNNAMAP